MNSDDLKNLYQSVSLLITSVPMPQGTTYNENKQYYLKLMIDNLKKLD